MAMYWPPHAAERESSARAEPRTTVTSVYRRKGSWVMVRHSSSGLSWTVSDDVQG